MEGVKKNVYFFVEVNMIFREMRQKKQELSRQEIADILHKGTSGVLAFWATTIIPTPFQSVMCMTTGKSIFTAQKAVIK